MIEALLPGGVGGGGMVPKGTIIGFSGTLAQADALNDWAICDGNNNTPNLNGRMIIGASGSYSFGSIGQGGRIGGTSSSSAGSHNPAAPTMSNATRDGAGRSSGVGGNHNHTLQTSTIPNPAARQTLFIQAIKETQIPQYGIVWMESAPSQGVAVGNGVFERFLVGVTGSARGNIGSNSLSIILRTSSGGHHDHITGSQVSVSVGFSNSSGGYNRHASSGGHTHTVAARTATVVPPWYGLIPGEAEKILAPWEGLVLAYNGSLESLPAPWREFTQLRGRFPRGAGIPGNTGGGAQQTISATPGSNTFSHTHMTTRSTSGNTVRWPHQTTTSTHSHGSMSLTYSNLPPYMALHYITI